ncbi:uncharacterized protein METZ01_LOCUS318306, partial [marine metagenome]
MKKMTLRRSVVTTLIYRCPALNLHPGTQGETGTG